MNIDGLRNPPPKRATMRNSRRLASTLTIACASELQGTAAARDPGINQHGVAGNVGGGAHRSVRL